jgi:methyl-accepting chemotaxis protein
MNSFTNMGLKWKLIFGFSIPLALLVAIATTVYFSLEKLLETNKWVNHTFHAIDEGKTITSTMVNMETGLRGFLVAGKEEFLEPYINGKAQFDEVMAATKKRVADNPTQVGRLNKVEGLKNQWLSEHVEVAMGYRREVAEGQVAADSFVEITARTVGKENFDGFRAALGKVDAAFLKSDDIEAQALVKLILLDMVNQETGQRGFLLSGQEGSLEPYLNGIVNLEKHAKKLRGHINNA